MSREKNFYPDYLAEILLVIFLVVELILVLSLLYPQQIGRPIDFSTPFRPKPEWYFLWLYQLIQYFPGRSIVIATAIIPMAGVLLFILIPFLDKGRRGRFKAVACGAMLLLSFILLTAIAVLNP